MTTEEYDKLLKEEEVKYNESLSKLAIKYAISNRKYNIGDILQCRNIKIKVDKINWSFNYGGYPCCVYVGYDLKKDNTPNKSNTRSKIYQTWLE